MLEDSPRRQPRILAVDDDPLVMRMLERVFAERAYTLIAAATGKQGIELFTQQHPDVLILDQVLPDMTGMDVLQQVRASDPYLPVLVITAQGTTITAIEAMKWGAFDYLPKPLDLPLLEQQVARALEVRRLTRVPVERARGEGTEGPGELLLGNSPSMQSVWKTIGRAAAQDGPALAQGEPGTGKELVARVLHLHGPCAGGPLAIVKCTDLGDPWLESELFGHEAGVITGVAGRRVGKVEQASGGTLFIDEVSALPPALQSKLVRLISERQFERLGSAELLAADVNVIATSTQPLGALVQQGAFRADLYYLLSTFTINLPPLRDRKEDIPLLVDHFVKRFSRITRTFDSGVARVSPEALNLLTAYDWPGNVDELQSVVRRALAETGGAVVPSEFLKRALRHRDDRTNEPSSMQQAPSWQSFVAQRLAAGTQSLYADALDEMDRQVMQAALDHTAGNQAQAAKILGITRGHLRKKIRALGLSLPGATSDAAAEHEAEEPLVSQ